MRAQKLIEGVDVSRKSIPNQVVGSVQVSRQPRASCATVSFGSWRAKVASQRLQPHIPSTIRPRRCYSASFAAPGFADSQVFIRGSHLKIREMFSAK